MNKKIIECPNCHLSNDEALDKCIYCGEPLTKNIDVVEQEETKATPKKRKLLQHELFFLISAALGLLLFLVMLLPGDGSGTSMYTWAFSSSKGVTKSGMELGINASVILFIILVVGILNHVATLRSLQRKTTEISLFSYFTSFFYILGVLVSFLSTVLMNNGTNSHFKMGVGFILTGVLCLLVAGLEIFANILYKKYLVNNPLETFKGQ